MGVKASGIYCVWQRDEESMTFKRLAITLGISVRRIRFLETIEGYAESQIILHKKKEKTAQQTVGYRFKEAGRG